MMHSSATSPPLQIAMPHQKKRGIGVGLKILGGRFEIASGAETARTPSNPSPASSLSTLTRRATGQLSLPGLAMAAGSNGTI